jgi:SAM-dependent methyltransferase
VTYVGVDVDADRLKRLRARCPSCRTVVVDATSLPFEDASFDYGVCIALSHHLDDDGLARLVDELVRVVRRRVVFLDAVWEPQSLRGRLLWAIDRGSHPRPESVLREVLERRFDVELTQAQRGHHHYLFCLLAPRDR